MKKCKFANKIKIMYIHWSILVFLFILIFGLLIYKIKKLTHVIHLYNDIKNKLNPEQESKSSVLLNEKIEYLRSLKEELLSRIDENKNSREIFVEIDALKWDYICAESDLNNISENLNHKNEHIRIGAEKTKEKYPTNIKNLNTKIKNLEKLGIKFIMKNIFS